MHRALISVRFDGGNDPVAVAAVLCAVLEDFGVVESADMSVVDDPIASRRADLADRTPMERAEAAVRLTTRRKLRLVNPPDEVPYG